MNYPLQTGQNQMSLTQGNKSQSVKLEDGQYFVGGLTHSSLIGTTANNKSQNHQGVVKLNSQANNFVFDIRQQFQPMSPQIQSLTLNQLKDKVLVPGISGQGQTEKNACEDNQIQNTGNQASTIDHKKNKTSHHRRNQSKSEYVVPTSFTLKIGKEEQLKQNQLPQENLIKSIVNKSTKNKGQKQFNQQNQDLISEDSLQQDSRNHRVRFNSLQTETFDKKSLEKIKKSVGAHQGYVNGGESTDDITSSKQHQQLSHLKFVASNDKDQLGKQLLKFTPNTKTTTKETDLTGSNKNSKRLSDNQQYKLQSTPFLNLQGNLEHEDCSKKVQFDDLDDNIEPEFDDDDQVIQDNDDENEMIGFEINKVQHKQSKRIQKQTESDYDEEEELKEEVGELPPKIEDLQVEEYEDDDDLYNYGVISAQNQDDEDSHDMPTVVIDSSMDDKDYAAEFRRIDSQEEINANGDNKTASTHEGMNNIQAALRSIKLQEEEELIQSKKKKVTIMSVEEEEAIVQQINDIRERIKKGETQSHQLQLNNQRQNAKNEDLNLQGNYHQSNLNQEALIALQQHFRSVDQAQQINYSQQTASFNTKQQETPVVYNYQGHNTNCGAIQKPPLYSLTFAHPHEQEQDKDKNPLLNGLSFKQGFHSIDNNMPMNCIITDGPNIFEKKKQRFERIQKMRGNLTGGQMTSDQVSNNQDHTPNTITGGGVSSSISGNTGNVPSSQKKSVDSTSNKGSVTNIKKLGSICNTATKKKLTSQLTNQKVKSLANKTSQKSRQGSTYQPHTINVLHFNAANSIGEISQVPMAGPMAMLTGDDATSNGSHSTKRLSKQPKSSQESHPSQQINLYSLKKVSNSGTADKSGSRHSAQGTIKKKLLHKSKKNPFSICQPPTTSDHLSNSKSKNLTSNLIINISQEPGAMGPSSSLKRLKTPKLKLKDDLLPIHSELMMLNPKRMSEFQSISTFKGGYSVKNTSTGTYKNPFFQSLHIPAAQASIRGSGAPGDKEHKSLVSSNERTRTGVESKSFNKLKTMQPQVNKTANQKLMCGIEPSFLGKLLKAKQESDAAFEVVKKRLNIVGGSAQPQQKQLSMAQAVSNVNQSGVPTTNQSLQDKSSFIEFEKKYRKLSGLVNKILA